MQAVIEAIVIYALKLFGEALVNKVINEFSYWAHVYTDAELKKQLDQEYDGRVEEWDSYQSDRDAVSQDKPEDK